MLMKHERLLKLAGTILLVAAGVAITWRTSEEVESGRVEDRGRSLVFEPVCGSSGVEADGIPGVEAVAFNANEHVSALKERTAVRNGGVPDSLQDALIGAMHAIQVVTEEERKLPENKGALYFASNPKNQGAVRFLEDGAVRFSAKGETCAVWQGRRMNEVDLERLGGPAVTGGEAKFHWTGGVSESFENVPEGLYHRIVLRERTVPADGGNLRLGIRLEDSIAQQNPAGDGIRITSRTASDVALHYGLPQVTDATGRALRASVSARGSQGFSIEVEDRAAVYPLNLGTLAVWKIRDAGLVDPDGRTQRTDTFGWAVAISGDTAAVGAPGDDTPFGDSAGSVYVFRQDRKGRWALLKQLRPPQGGRMDVFGTTVSLSADTLVASAPYASPDEVYGAGCLWVYTRSGKDWLLDQRITSPSIAGSSGFGTEMALYEDRIIASVPTSGWWNGNVFGHGNVYAYVRKPGGWELEATLGDLPEHRWIFGSTGDGVALSGDLAVVAGAATAQEIGVFVFRRVSETWTFEAFLSPPEYQGSSDFGVALGIAGNQILVGDPEGRRKSDLLSTGALSVYEFHEGQWTLKQEICPDYLYDYDHFGIEFAVSGTSAIIRAPAIRPFEVKPIRGRDYLFELVDGIWVRKATLSYPEARPGEARATGNAISGDTALLSGSKTEVKVGKWKTVEDVDMVSVIRLTQEISVEGPGKTPLASGQPAGDFFDLRWEIGEKPTRTFVVKNTGLLPLEGLKTSIDPGSPGDFFVSKPLPAHIDPGESALLIVGFAPKSEGRHKATVRIFSNDANERPFELKVKGKAVVKR